MVKEHSKCYKVIATDNGKCIQGNKTKHNLYYHELQVFTSYGQQTVTTCTIQCTYLKIEKQSSLLQMYSICCNLM